MDKNLLYYGDNLDILRRHVRDESVNLCYIDPPFNSKRSYNQIYNNIGREDRAQAQAFIDTWTWDTYAIECFEEILSNKNRVQTRQSIDLIIGLDKVLGRGNLFAYLVNMTVRIAEIHRALKDSGSFYLHCDPTSSHYLKLICDSLFIPRGGDYRNEIVWRRTTNSGSSKSTAKKFPSNSDIILFYVKSDEHKFEHIKTDYSDKYKSRFTKEDERGFYYLDNLKTYSQNRLQELIADNRIEYTSNGKPRIKNYLHEGKGLITDNIWTDIDSLNSQAAERLGYPTQKPEALLERIISTSSNEGDTVLDAYCGCGTTTAVAQRLNRRWIGIDITYQSISLIMKRLTESHGKRVLQQIDLNGVPRDLESVNALVHKKDDRVRKEFEKWAILTYSDNRAVINEKKGADRGIDGVTFVATARDEVKPAILSVKSGHVGVGIMHELRGVIERENAACGIPSHSGKTDWSDD